MPRRWAACSTRSTMPTPASSEPRRYRGALIGAGGIARQSHLPRCGARWVAAASRASGRVGMPCHQYRYNPVWLRVKEWLAAGAIGRSHLAEFSVHRLAADPGRTGSGGEGGSTPWRGTSAAGRGCVLLDHGTHLVYQLLDVAGMPAAVSAWTGRLRHVGYDVEDTAALRF